MNILGGSMAINTPIRYKYMLKLLAKILFWIILIPFIPMILITDLIYSILNKIKSIAYPEKYHDSDIMEDFQDFLS